MAAKMELERFSGGTTELPLIVCLQLNEYQLNSFKQPNMREEYRVDTSCKTYQVTVQIVKQAC